MSAHRPDVVGLLCSEIRATSRKVEADYKWLYASGYEPRRRGVVGGSGGAGPVDAGNAAVRGRLERVAKKVTAAKLAMAAAADELGGLADLIDEAEITHPALPDLAAARGLGSWSDNHDAGEASARARAARGAALPGSDYGLPRQVIEAHKALDAVGVHPDTLARRVLAAAGIIDRLRHELAVALVAAATTP